MKDGIVAWAKAEGWESIPPRDPHMVGSFLKVIDHSPARINIWESERRGRTVGTYLFHPKQGKTQLFRRCVSDKELQQIFKNPRVHSGKGYK